MPMSASAVVIHYEEALYQMYAPLKCMHLNEHLAVNIVFTITLSSSPTS